MEDLQQNKRPLTEDQREHPNVWHGSSNSKKLAVGEEMTPKVKKEDKTSQDSKPARRKRSPYSETTTSKKPRVEGYVRNGPTTSTSTDEQIDLTHVTPGLCTNALGKPTELLSGAVQGFSGRDMKTSSKKREFVRSPVTGLTPDDPAYDEGTNTVTATIVKLWREKVKQRGGKDLAKETIEKALVFELNELEELDGKRYNALTKACSLPSVGIRLVSHLLNVKKMDVNSQIPSSFNSDDRAARWLTPGMSALSMAIKRSNVRCVPTFMKRKTKIDFKSTDREKNTALHHCVLSSVVPKTAFDRLFRCYKVLEWREMKNVQDKSPLDIAKERLMESHTNNDEKMEEDFEHVLKEMGCTVTIVNVTDDDDDGDDDEDDDDEDEDDNDGKEDDEDTDSEDDEDDGTSSDSNDDDDSGDNQDVHSDAKVDDDDDIDDDGEDTNDEDMENNYDQDNEVYNSDGNDDSDDSDENMDNNDDDVDDDNDNGDSNDDDDNHEHKENNGDDNNSYNDTESDDNDSNDNADNSDEDTESNIDDNYDAQINNDGDDDNDDDIDDWWRRQQRRLPKHWRV